MDMRESMKQDDDEHKWEVHAMSVVKNVDFDFDYRRCNDVMGISYKY